MDSNDAGGYTLYMQYLAIKRKLTRHLAGEESLDFHDDEARVQAIHEAYYYISERWKLQERYLPADGSLPADFYSYSTNPGTYNAQPFAMFKDTDEPWQGRYLQVHDLISFYAAFRLYQDKGPEMYERAMFWKNLFDERATVIDRTLNRQNTARVRGDEGSEDTYGGMRNVLLFDLDTSAMTPEQIEMVFPSNIRDGALKRAYREITTEHELTIKTLTLNSDSGVVESVNGLRTIAWTLPPDFMTPMNQIGLSNGTGIIGGEYPYTQASSYAPSFEIVSDDGARKIIATNLRESVNTITIRYIASPPPLVNQSDKPWNGDYPTANKLIVLRAMRDLLRSKKELYQLSRFWQNEYDREVVEFKKLLKRRTLGQANRVVWGHTSAGIGDEVININWPDHLKNYVEWM